MAWEPGNASLNHGTSHVSPVYLVLPIESRYVAVGQSYRTSLSSSDPTTHTTIINQRDGHYQLSQEGNPT